MKPIVVKIVIGLVSVLLFGAVCVGVIYNPFGSAAPATLQADLRNQIVAVPDTANPGQLLGWYFDSKDELDVKVLDSRKEDYKRVYYVQVTTKSKDGQTLNGILEAYYVTIAKTPYLIALNSINLQMSAPPPPPNAQPPPAKTPTPPPGLQPAQRLPGQ